MKAAAKFISFVYNRNPAGQGENSRAPDVGRVGKAFLPAWIECVCEFLLTRSRRPEADNCATSGTLSRSSLGELRERERDNAAAGGATGFGSSGGDDDELAAIDHIGAWTGIAPERQFGLPQDGVGVLSKCPEGF